MTNAFVSFAGEDRDFVLEMVQHAEQSGQHRVWHFTRDSRPAHVYLEEIVQAVRGCDVFILIASTASLDSFQVDKEVQLAHENNKVILLIQMDVTSEDIQAAQPGWLLPLGARTYLRLNPEREHALFSEITRSLDSFSPPPVKGPARWAADATFIQLSDLQRVLFQTPAVKEFLEGDHQFFVSANKGVGKTLLLKSKRARLMEEHSSQPNRRSEVLFLPQDKPYLDNLAGEWPTLNSETLQFLANLRCSRRLWVASLKLSVLSHFPDLYVSLNTDGLTVSVSESLKTCVSEKSSPAIIFRNFLTTQTVKKIHAFLDRTDTLVERLFRSVHSGVVCFIDTVEQGVTNLSREAWMHLQAGLIEAAWDVMTSNNHIKIYAGIREEAFANYTSTSKINLYSAALSLRYSLEELHQMLDSLSRLYERESSFHQFAGRCTVKNLHCRVEEDTFRYVHRHTVGRPRDLVVICSEVARNRASDSEERFRETVNSAASNTLLPLVFSEMNVFLDCLGDESERYRFLRMLPHNIMSRREVESICAAFNGMDAEGWRQLCDNGVEFGHPFCELYNCGLIGTVLEDRVHGSVLQRFRQPNDMMTRCRSCLPAADYYLIHPSLHDMISHLTGGRSYHVLRYIAVGHRYPWRPWNGALVDLQKSLPELTDVSLRQQVLNCIGDLLTETDGESAALPDTIAPLHELQILLEQRGFDDVYLHIDRLLAVLSDPNLRNLDDGLTE